MQHKLIILGVAILAAGALWYGMSQSTDPAATIVTSSVAGTSNTPGGAVMPGPVDKDTQQILEILLALRAVKLDETIFSSNSFISLKDFSTKIIPEPAGRPDPFAPFDSVSSSVVVPSASNNQTTQSPQSQSSQTLDKLQTLKTLQKTQTKTTGQ